MSIPKDQKLYDNVKKVVYKEMPTHSAYRSGQLVKRYKEAYEKKYGNKNAYEGKKKENSKLKDWFDAEWKNQRGEIGYKFKSDIYRPTKKITKETPTTFSELTKKEIERAKREKREKGRVKKFKK